jgi:hypothetical protein
MIVERRLFIMDSIPNPSVTLQLVPESEESIPEWFAELVVIVETLRQQGALTALLSEVNLVRGRMGDFESIDYLAVLIGYAVSGQPTLQSFFERISPFGQLFMGLFGRDRLPSRAALSRYLSAMTADGGQRLRALFERFSFGFGWTAETLGGLTDRSGERLLVIDVDGTRQVARQRRLPTSPDLPQARRRMEQVCAVGYPGRKRGQVVRSRMTALNIHTHQWLFTCGGAGNGQPEEELACVLSCIGRYLQVYQLPSQMVLVRLDGQFGIPMFLRILQQSPYWFVTRSIGYHLLSWPQVQAVLALPATTQVPGPTPDQPLELFDVGELELDETGIRARLIVLRRPAPAGRARLSVGYRQGHWVYELFLTRLPATRLLAEDVLSLYRGRGGFENSFAAEDQETDPDRWCSHTCFGQDCWQILAQWVWNLRQALGKRLLSQPCREIQWADPAPMPPQVEVASEEAVSYGPWHLAPSTRGVSRKRLKASSFSLSSDAQVLCPAGQPLAASGTTIQDTPYRQRQVWKAHPKRCATCPLRTACLGEQARPTAYRSVSTVRLQLPPTSSLRPREGLLPALHWRDVPARALRRRFMTHLHHQQVHLTVQSHPPASPIPRPPRAERAHQRLSWLERRSRNAGPSTPRFALTVSGIPEQLLTL